MSSQTPPRNVFDRIQMRFFASRFVTLSLFLHTVFVLLVGGTVLHRMSMDPPDFDAGAEGLVVETADQTGPPDIPQSQPMEQFTPQAPTLSVPLNALTTTSLQSPSWKMAAVPDAPARGIADSMKGAMASLGDKLAQGGGTGGGAMGRAGGMRTATIFGKKIEAAKLGVILDVSGSAHPHLAGAIAEIQKGFADATLILYPGCGLTDFEGKSDHEIRKYSSISKRDREASAGNFTTPAQLAKALKIAEFEKMADSPAIKDTLFVSWYAEKGADGKLDGTAGKLIGQTQAAFEELIKRGADTIYWFADFADPVAPREVERLSAKFKNKSIKLHVHNFAGKKINPLVVEMAENSGGTVNTEKPK